MEQLTKHTLLLDTLKDGVYEWEYVLNDDYFSGIEKSDIIGGEVKAQARLTLKIDDIRLHIKVEGIVGMACDRCLDRVDMNVAAADDCEIEPKTKEIDLYWLAYELIAVNLPMVHCHPEGGCNPEMIALLHDHLHYQEEPEEV